MYKLTKNDSILRLADNACIPKDPSNTDYINYLSWVTSGNAPSAADNPSKGELNAPTLAKLLEIDGATVRSLREFIVTLPACPQIIKDREADAIAERLKIVK